MAYRLKLGEKPSEGFQRIAREQLVAIEGYLKSNGDPVAAVHDSRKALKRLRSLLRLVRKALPDGVFEAENARLGEAARLLSQSRDRDVLVTLVAALPTMQSDLTDDELAVLARAASAVPVEPSVAGEERPDRSWTAAAKLIRQSKRALSRVRLSPDDMEIVFAGLEEGYRRCRRAFDRAQEGGIGEAYHEWRKDVQRHWRHHALLRQAWPQYAEARVALAKEIADLLGEDQDLSVLLVFLDSEAGHGIDAALADKVRSVVHGRQALLRRRVTPLGTKLVAEGARGHARRMAHYWASQREARKIEREQSGPR
jgi:CHAD domain-containing protein